MADDRQGDVAPVPARWLEGPFGRLRCIDLPAVAGGREALARMPWCHRILLENVMRQPEAAQRAAGRAALMGWLETGQSEAEIPFAPGRILMHDTTCGPALVDIAAMRDVLAQAGGDPARLNPAVPVATSTDHSLPVDVSARPDAVRANMANEMARNAERYRFMKWAAGTVNGFRVFPPGTGIMHTINLERLATVVSIEIRDGEPWAVPDTLVGTDSHTPMVNGIGVLGWGVGGIEAEGVMFDVPVSLRVPEVVGVRLEGAVPEGSLATDLALTVTQMLRAAGISGEFVEFFGPGIGRLTAGQRAVVANMAPEYGATTGIFPIDEMTLRYLQDTGRDAAQVALVESYAKAQGLWHEPAQVPRYTRVLELDLASIRPSLAGPRRPQDRLAPAEVPAALRDAGIHGGGAPGQGGIPADAVAIAAVTSCTNTTDLGLLVAAGLVARKARAMGLQVPRWVKTSLTPGSPSAERRLRRAGLLQDLEALGFGIAGYGCATCIGNSGPLLPEVAEAVRREGLRPVAVLSGNRNFPGRVHAQVDAALLASPPLVVAYAIAGRAALDIGQDVLATTPEGRAIRLADLWPSAMEIEAVTTAASDPADIALAAAEADGSAAWAALEAPGTARFPWDATSTYLRPPPFVNVGPDSQREGPLVAHPLLVLGDDITTDHISPAGAIPARSDAASWLVERGENPQDLNVYASRRGNWEVMLRGLFTNKAAVNHLAAGLAPGQSVFALTGEVLPVWRAAARYEEAGLPVVILAGERYGTGSSRDWAAKGAQLLGVRAVLANSFERIHRANLVGMGVLPLRLPDGWRFDQLGLEAGDLVEVALQDAVLKPRAAVPVVLRRRDGSLLRGTAMALLDTAREVSLIQAGGMIPTILRRALAAGRA
ncbi:aconitate hydratase AcnA [Pseudoroseomonas wenyumeiae]|uniref:Aconitate hydratase A n=1 Tax=Teichococcus wenyumeiae TaxID=2478470 RepID=A0A3A9JZ79_9PROT|nr:aconitate hydratase AcnA [Pseudoroseomonas wenyumeiae]RKK04399.1 aconitate hydratase AcnA [Pseudoroseomonas wenyumeiae]RMI19319.1 aconitate hydratase AcnA [Pseudoroseomonas wenyumeiae]